MNETEIPTGFTIEVKRSDTGDDCHRNIKNVATAAMKKAFDKKRVCSFFHICDPSGVRALTEDDLQKYK